MRKKLIAVLIIFSVFMLCSDKFIFSQTSDVQFIEFLEFRDVDIKNVLRQLAKQYDLNIVFSESVTGLVTVMLNNVTIQQALDSIITVNGFVYSKKDNVYKVTTPDEAEREGRITRLFQLNNASAVDLVKKENETLQGVLTKDGTIKADERSNSIIVSDIPSVIVKIEGMLPVLDSLTPQILIEAKLIETSLTNSEKLGIDWTTTISAKGAKRPTTVPFNKWSSGGSMYPVPKYSTEYDSTTGDTLVTSDFPFGGEGVFFPNESVKLGSFPMAVASNFTFGTLDFTSLQMIFDFLKTRQDTNLVANPRIVTLNNQQATINVGKAIPIATYERNSTTGKWEITGWEKQKEMVGVNLQVTPQVSPEGWIKLKLKPEVSSIFDWITDEDGNRQRPITTTRVAETEVQIKNGQTVVIGGLVKNKTITTVKKIPILSDIPLLGVFFTRKDVSSSEDPNEQTDLLIFVTATIIEETEQVLVAWKQHIITSPPRPFRLSMKKMEDIIKKPEK